ncbi:MAG: hypothetical protein BZY87_02990 [SAR202 cluster bacterium Io17-Chloro-G6]|nr:MAG: hypothetical protein BZY87_02990 [SAR202 cluster bacterium Io17-Chloro-G6]
MKVQAAYNGDDMIFRSRFPADKPGIHHDYLVFEGSERVRHGSSSVGSVDDRLYEDRFTFHVDDGAVKSFPNYGCAVTCHSDLRDPFMYQAPGSDEVKANSYYEVIGKSDVRKYIPESRRGDGEWWDVAWDDIQASDTDFIAGMKVAGVFLDQWHWRAARGNPLDVSDDLWVLDYRNGDAGGSSYSTNFDSETGQPRFMFDPGVVPGAALSFDDVTNQRLTLDDVYYLGPETMTEFDPNRAWQEGDAIPRRYLRAPKGSRADITAKPIWNDGWWTVELRRKMDTGEPDDKAFKEFRSYNLAFAFYTNGTGNRFHYVTFPVKLGMGQPGDINATRFAGDDPNWDAVPAAEFTAYYPGQASWQYITSDRHLGAPAVRADSVACSTCHAAGNGHGLRLDTVHHEHHCGYAGRFDGPGDQSPGLMAKGSSCADDHPINAVVLETAGHLRPAHFDQPRWIGDITHEAEGWCLGFADDSLSLQVQQPVHGQDGVNVFGYPDCVVMGVGYPQLVQGGV